MNDQAYVLSLCHSITYQTILGSGSQLGGIDESLCSSDRLNLKIKMTRGRMWKRPNLANLGLGA